MRVDGVRWPELNEIAASLDLQLEPRSYGAGAFAVKPTGNRWCVILEGDRDNEEERVVCGHGHEALIAAILRSHPQATVITALTTYRGLRDFAKRQPAIREKYITEYGADPCTCRRFH